MKPVWKLSAAILLSACPVRKNNKCYSAFGFIPKPVLRGKILPTFYSLADLQWLHRIIESWKIVNTIELWGIEAFFQPK